MPTKERKPVVTYATEEERKRINNAAERMGQSVSAFVLDCVMEQVASIEEIIKKNEV